MREDEAADSASSVTAPPRAYSEKHHFADYRRAGEHRDILQRGRSHRHRRRRHDRVSIDSKQDKFSAKVNLLCCVFHPTKHRWSTAPACFDRIKDNDRDVWYQIRQVYRNELTSGWGRMVSFKKLVAIVPIEYTHNGVPVRTKLDDYPVRHSFMHAYHHPNRIQADQVWMEWFTQFRESGDVNKTYGLEFVQGLYIEKLAIIALGLTLSMVVACFVWCFMGGDLATVFTVMDFVESGFAAIIALTALYYQMVLVQ